jgi:putative intracellular protease/amidase
MVEENNEPLIKLEAGRKAPILSYNVPEPTAYFGNNMTELEFTEDYFKPNVKKISETSRTSAKDLDPSTLRNAVVEGIKGDFDAIVVVGGQGPMFTFKQETDLQNKFLGFYNKGKDSAALCHGTSLLLYLKDKDGSSLIQGKNMTGYTDEEEEDFSDKYVDKKAMPFRIEDEAKKLGAEFKKTTAFEPFAIKDGNLITGQQQHSGAEVAKLVIDSLGK